MQYHCVQRYYTNIPCVCGQYTRIFSRGTLNCMDVLYSPMPTAEGNITHPCNSLFFYVQLVSQHLLLWISQIANYMRNGTDVDISA